MIFFICFVSFCYGLIGVGCVAGSCVYDQLSNAKQSTKWGLLLQFAFWPGFVAAFLFVLISRKVDQKRSYE